MNAIENVRAKIYEFIPQIPIENGSALIFSGLYCEKGSNENLYEPEGQVKTSSKT